MFTYIINPVLERHVTVSMEHSVSTLALNTKPKPH